MNFSASPGASLNVNPTISLSTLQQNVIFVKEPCIRGFYKNYNFSTDDSQRLCVIVNLMCKKLITCPPEVIERCRAPPHEGICNLLTNKVKNNNVSNLMHFTACPRVLSLFLKTTVSKSTFK